ncbi:MAG: DUF4062 domain-containing protein [Anaerolineales bacterium]|nr:MAG: DUF4062 domain-containing protein [Anaerolineales bacterium]
MAKKEIKTVFLSSTARDLAQYRETVTDAINGLDDYKCVRMEDFGARDWAADDFCRAKVAECNLFVGVVGHLYGSCPEGSEQSYTEREYEAAIGAEMPRLMFIAPEDFPLPAHLIESDEKRAKQQAFRNRVNAERIRDEFTSPDDLARRVVQGIRNWEQEQAAAQRRPPAARAERLIPLPPHPYLAHRYPMPENWMGRLDEIDQLDAWLEDDEGTPMCCLIAIGGMGKSSLAWAWLQRRVMARQKALGLSGVFQWSFYEGEISFRRFLEDLATYLGVSAADDPVTALVQRLAEQPILLVLDGFERLLCAYASVDAALLPERTAEELEAGERRCADLAMARFLRSLVADTASKILLASRLVPEELDRLAGWRLMELPGLAPDDAVAYLQACGIRGTRRELQDAAAAYGFHPLSLSKLVEVLHYDVHQPDDVRQAPSYDVTLDLKARQNHLLERAYETLPLALAQFLSALAALRGKATMDVVRFLAGDWSDAELSANLRRLEEDRWITWEREQQTLDFHPVVRRYVYERLEDKPGTHTRLRDYFAAVPPPEQVESLDDLAPTIELYHHTVRAGRYDEAVRLLRDRLVPDPLHFRFGAYQLMIELERALFPGGEPFIPSGEAAMPHLSDEAWQAWTLNALSAAYAMSGQPGRAVPLVGGYVAISRKRADGKNEAIGLANLATQQIAIGALAVAEESLRRAIELDREIGGERDEACDHQELACLLAYTGAFEEAGRELGKSYEYDSQHGDRQGECVDWAYRALRALLMVRVGGEESVKDSLPAARRAHEIACSHQNERDRIRAEWLLGAAHRARGELAQAEPHLEEALRRCRRINLIELEPNILLELARLRHAQAALPSPAAQRAGEGPGVGAEALSLAQEALEIADRCEYRLVQADCHNFLAQLALALSEAGPEPRRRVEGLEAGDIQKAQEHAETARQRAWCDGPPHRYEAAFQEAERLLERLGVSDER